MPNAFTDAPPYTLEHEGDGRYRVRVAAGFIGNVFGSGRRWTAEYRDKHVGPFPSRGDAALAVWTDYDLDVQG